MSIQFPLKAVQNPGARFAHIVDASERVIAGALRPEDADELVRVANLGSMPPRMRAKKEKAEEALRRSDLTAQIMDRTDIGYGPHDSLPRGEHVARLRK